VTSFYFYYEKESNFWVVSPDLSLSISAKRYLKISAEYGMTSYYGIIEPESEERLRIFNNLMETLTEVLKSRNFGGIHHLASRPTFTAFAWLREAEFGASTPHLQGLQKL
jgi:hypothetical protein